MRKLTTIGAALLCVGAAGAQERAFTQPYWTERPVIEAIGKAEVRVAPNRASFAATYQEVADTADVAAARATEAARQGADAIRARVGADSVRIEANFDIEPLYEQYRDREGNRVDNERADRITSYQAEVTLAIEVLTLAKAADARAAALAARPQAVSQIGYSLLASPEMRQATYRAAVEDAAAKARIAVAATCGRLGRVLVVQDGQGPCLGQWYAVQPGARELARAEQARAPNSSFAGGADGEIVVTASRRRAAITVADIDRLVLPSEPDAQTLNASVCVIYAVEP